jgi:hypothetical protein
MQVNKTPGELARTDAVQRTQQPAAPAPATTDAPSAVHRVDAVQISDAGRAMSGTDGDVDGTSQSTESTGLDPRRADEIRTRVLSGAYNSVEMADQVARSILRSGDL